MLVSPRLSEPWILDCEVMVKPLYSRQEGEKKATTRTNPAGRRTHTIFILSLTCG